MSRSDSHVAIVGAGPYGLAAAAHLRAAGVETIVFGEPMAFWERHMPVGMLLRSQQRSSNISDPHRTLTLADYERATEAPLARPLPLETFVAYGHWFRQQVAPDVDRRRVVRVDSAPSGFSLLLDDGETMRARRVVVAAGIEPFAWSPDELAGLPESLASHSSTLRDVGAFAGRRVLVVGGGQSALEDAALLHEAGADVEVLVRRPRVHWIPIGSPNGRTPVRRWIDALMYPPTDVGPPGLNWIAGAPDVFRRMPRRAQPEIGVRCTLPVGASWLKPRLAAVQITKNCVVTAATAAGGRLRLSLDDGSRREVDHVVVATGYRVDVSKYEFLGPELLRSLRLADGYPVLSTGLETSIAGLHFLGAPAAASFGPVMRFVTGSAYAAPALERKVNGKPPLLLRFAW
jgi:cation diffusion facilitator CzcD-associated flavoprotein CzcO